MIKPARFGCIVLVVLAAGCGTSPSSKRAGPVFGEPYGSGSPNATASTDPNPDTATLEALTSGSGRPVATTVHLRGTVISLAPMLPPSNAIPAQQAQLDTAAQHYGAPSTQVFCRFGALTDTDVYTPGPGGGKILLYDKTATWMCFQLRVPTDVNNPNAAPPSNFVSFLNATSGTELFTIQDGS